MSSMKSQVAIVTGGASGIGRAISLRLAREGVSVAICDINKDKAEHTAEEIRALGSETLVVKTDVSKAGDVKHAVDETLRRFGRLDFLVNNAGIGYATGSLADPTHVLIENLTEEEWDPRSQCEFEKRLSLLKRSNTTNEATEIWKNS